MVNPNQEILKQLKETEDALTAAAAAATTTNSTNEMVKNSAKPAKRNRQEEEEEESDVEDPQTMMQRRLAKDFESKRSPEEILQEQQDRENFRISAAQLTKLQNILNLYQGTHNFHNYTSGKKPHDDSAKRFIMWFKAMEPKVFGKLEWIALRVQGQSFMLHQIRKMVGMAIAIMRTNAEENQVVPLSFRYDKWNIPRAPGAGLFLDEVKFERYNLRLNKMGQPQPPLDWSDIQVAVNDFKATNIYPAIMEDEKNYAFLEFLRCIDFYDSNMSYLRMPPSSSSSSSSLPLVELSSTTSVNDVVTASETSDKTVSTSQSAHSVNE